MASLGEKSVGPVLFEKGRGGSVKNPGFPGFRKLPLSVKNIFLEMGRGVAMKSQMGLSWHAIELS